MIDTKGWVNSWMIGFLGQYCEEGDYFSFDKWYAYPTEIKYMIVSWIIF